MNKFDRVTSILIYLQTRTVLTAPKQYAITRKKKTERAFSSQMCSLFEPGKYACVCCDTMLFDSATRL